MELGRLLLSREVNRLPTGKWGTSTHTWLCEAMSHFPQPPQWL